MNQARQAAQNAKPAPRKAYVRPAFARGPQLAAVTSLTPNSNQQ